MPKSSTDDQQQRADLMASRLRTLLDAAEATTGSKVTYTELSEHLAAKGITLSRARWSYMTNGHRLVDDAELLDGISAYFDVPNGYLRGEANLPDKTAAKLDLVRAMRDAEVRTFATRMYGDLAPETLNAIINIIDNQEAARAGGTQDS
ncbi:MAG: hypothetical protein J0J04_08240 [Microbacterium sp.]|uniref:hypothetical protein n=1 Tax=Microbacterium sp. TaxID=51671 RepID=UPI001AC8FD8A|nr:hypothetical protein [Microbacterium sp.]MBN9214790.1 hypothetical protein [Microbacterium sp.]